MGDTIRNSASFEPKMETLTKKERVLRTFEYKPLDRPAIYDKIHSLKFIEHVYGKPITEKNAEDAICTAIAKKCDMTRHVVIPDNLEPYKYMDEDGFVYRIYWNTKEIIRRPFQTVQEASELVRKDIDRIRQAIEQRRLCHQAKWHLKLFGEQFGTPEELNHEFRRVQKKMDGPVVVAPEFFDGIGPVTTRYNYDTFVYLYHDCPELMHDLLSAHCAYQLFLLDSFEGPELTPVALMSTAVSGTQGLIFSPEFLKREFFPVAHKIVTRLKKLGYKVILEMEGDVRQVIDDIVATGTDGYTTVEELANMSCAWLKKRYPKLVLSQMIDSTQLLTHGSRKAVEEKTNEIIELLEEYGGIFIGSSGDINEEVRVENALVMMDTAMQKNFNH
jgi:hypothetical protein